MSSSPALTAHVLVDRDLMPAGFAPDRHSAGGLGMKLVALLVSQLDGRLSAGANPAARGACFTVTFPQVFAPGVRILDKSHRSERWAPLGSCRIRECPRYGVCRDIIYVDV